MTTTGPGSSAFPPLPPVPAPGDDAPDFTLPWKVGEPPFRLHDHVGDRPVVVLFFPLAFSPLCTDELCMAGEDLASWNEVGGATVVAVSVDSIWASGRFAEETGVGFPVLSDFNRDACTAWGVRSDDYFGMRGVAKRSAFVVDRQGKVAYAWVADEESDDLPDLDAVRRAVEVG